MAPGSAGYNLLCLPGLAGVLIGDFERSGGVEESDPEYLARVTRPGAILLANLDVNDASRLPAPPADRVALIDGADDRINNTSGSSDDESTLTLLKVRKPSPCALHATRVVMRVHADDAERIRLFKVGAGVKPVLGRTTPGIGAPATPTFSLPAAAGAGFAHDFRLEAITLAGDPRALGPVAAPPNKPDPYPATLPVGSTGTPLYATRAPGEIWVELVHQNGAGADLPAPYDTGVFTIAPWLALTSTLPCQRAYAVYFGTGYGSNHGFMYDLAEGCRAAFGAAVVLPPDTSTAFKPNDPTHTGPLYIVDGKYRDPWIQDEIEIGYCWAPHAWMHVVLHCKRNRGLDDFVHRELPGPRMGVFDGLHGPERDSQDYGGNIEASPPVATPTPALPRDDGGPSVPAHPPAPLGKIILGDRTPRPVHDDFRSFLFAQHAQPVLPVDTSWLIVGHVDEFMTFVKSPSPRGYKLVLASVRAMDLLLAELMRIPFARRSGFHRGKYKGFDPRGAFLGDRYAELSVEQIVGGPIKAYSKVIREQKLLPIEDRLRRGLGGLANDEIIRLPTYWEVPFDDTMPLGDPANQTIAETVGSVNMLVLDRHLMVPRPFGPRLPTADAHHVVRMTLDRLRLSSVAVSVPPESGFWFWAFPGETVQRIAAYFTPASTPAARRNVVESFRTGTPLSPANAAAVSVKRAAIEAAPENRAAPNPLPSGARQCTGRVHHGRHDVP